MGTVFQKYPKEKRAFINPEDFTKQNPHFPELCVSTFSNGIIDKFASLNNVKVIDHLYTANGSVPIYQIIYKNTPIAFYLSRVGAPACVAGIEEVIALGAKKIVLFGSCGILEASADNKIIVPTSAVRDEGTSYHYLKAADEISVDENIIHKITKCLDKCGYSYITGKTWTTDILIVGLVSDDGVLKGGNLLIDAPFKDDMFTIDEIMIIKHKYRIKQIIVTHIDEYWGKSYADYQKIEKKFDNISFAYDGMEIIL